MPRFLLLQSALVGLALTMLAGCGGKRTPEDLVKTYVDLVNAEAAEYEIQLKSPDPTTLRESMARLAKVEADRKTTFDAIEKLSKVEYFAALSKHQLEMKRANTRLRYVKDLKNKAGK